VRVPDAEAGQAGGPATSSEAALFVTADPGEETAVGGGPTELGLAKRVAWRAASVAPASTPATTDVRDSWQPQESGDTPVAQRRRGGRWKWVLLVLVLLAPVGVVGTLFVLPMLRPKDPREQIAQRYLDAIRRADWAEANRLSVLTAHPRLVRVENVALIGRESIPIRGKFLGLAEFHTRIDQKYRFNPDRGRFDLKDTTGTGIELLGQVEKLKEKVEEKVAANAAASSKRSKNPEDQMLDDVLARYGAIADLAKNPTGLLSTQNLAPTYKDLLDQTDVPLSDVERSLGMHYATDWSKWDRLLGRSFLTLPGGGEFELQEVELQAVIRTEGQSYGEPGRPLKLRLLRFTMGTIDTGWRVWTAD
jgi:hypothetical protein